MLEDSSTKTLPQPEPRRSRAWATAAVVLLTVIFLYFFSQVVGAAALGIFAALQHWNAVQFEAWVTNSVTAQFVYSLIADGLLVGGIVVVMRRLKWRWSTIGLTAPKIWQLILGVVAAVPYYFIYILILAVVSVLIPSFNPAQKQDIGFGSVHGSLSLILTFVSLVILPPIAEEITMRGFLYTGLKKWLPRVVAALAVSLLFGAAHLAEGGATGPLWVGALDTFVLSMVLVTLREATGNLWAGIVLHAVKNAVAFASIFLIAGR